MRTIENDMPVAPNIISCRLPNFSIVKTAIQEARKYSNKGHDQRYHSNTSVTPRLACAISGSQNSRDERRKLDLILIYGSCVVSDEINPGDLLKHLIDVCKHRSMKMSVLITRKQVTKSPLRHLQNSILDCSKLAINVRVVNGQIAQSTEDVKRFVFFSFQNQPSRRFG